MATKEKNKELKLKLEDLTKQLKANSKDARWADKLIKEIISVKGQIDVIPTDDMINEFKMDYKHDYGATAIMAGSIREVPTYVYASTGYRLVARADSMRTSELAHSLYQWLDALVSFQRKADAGETLSENEEQVLESLLYTADAICQVPIFGFYDDEISLAFIKVMGEQMQRITAPLINSVQQKPEEEGALEDMQQRVELAEQLNHDNTNKA